MTTYMNLRATIIGLLMSLGPVGCSSLCENTIVQQFPSPDGQLRAVLFNRDCGATTAGDASHVVILSIRDSLPEDPDCAFSADCNHGTVPHEPWGGPKVEVTWSGNRELQIKYHPNARLFRAEKLVSVSTGIFSSEKVSVLCLPE